MRFISPTPAYQIVAVHQDTELLADGSRRVKQDGFVARFKQSDTTDVERELARQRFQFRGTTQNMDGSQVDPITRVSSFDTLTVHISNCECDLGERTAPCEKMRERVEKAMLRNADYGKPDGYILVEKPLVAAPWPNYDDLKPVGRRTIEMVAEQIAGKVRDDGYPVDQVRAYEIQEHNRPEVLAALAALEQSEPAEDLVTA